MTINIYFEIFVVKMR